MYERYCEFDVFSDSHFVLKGCSRPGARNRNKTDSSPRIFEDLPSKKRLESMVQNFETGMTIDGNRPLSPQEMEACGMKINEANRTAVLPNGQTVKLATASTSGE